MNRRIQAIKYLIADTISAGTAWALFFVYRKYYLEFERFGELPKEVFDTRFYQGIVIVPLCWVFFYYLIGYYNNPYRKSRLAELIQTFITAIFGVTIIFFISILDDQIKGYQSYYRSYFTLLTLHFVLTSIPRLILSTRTNQRIHKREIGFKTLLIGSNENALKIYEEINNLKRGSGNLFIGFIHVDQKNGYSEKLKQNLPHLGEFKDIREIILKHDIEEIIIAIESWEHEYLQRIINECSDFGVLIKIIPDMYDILSGSVKMTSILGAPLIEINRDIMPQWQINIKRIFDVVFSLMAMICFSWLYLILAIGVKLSSKGPILYSHERIGLHGRPFRIYKFRSMYTDSEKMGPALSSENDPRITPFGKFLRKSRLDEFPQFFNVLIGEMSIVGPRPERQFYIDQIVQKAPHYKHLHKVRPGITSWGQVKYGYASTVDEMIKRLKYDILYIENMSLMVDLKIIIYTVLIVLQGRGK